MRRARRIALVILLLVTACLLIGFGLIESSWFKERARRYVINEAARYLNGTLSIGAIRGNWWSGVELLDVKVVQDGESAVAIRSLTVSYQFRELFRNGATRIRSLELSGLSLFLDHRADGSWNVAHLLKPRKTAGGPGRPIDLDRIEIGDSTILIQGNRSASAFRLPERILDINAVARFRNRADMRVIEVESLEARGIDPGFAVRRYSGTVELPDGRIVLRAIDLQTERTALKVDGSIATRPGPARFDLKVVAERFDFQEVARILPGIHTIGVSSAFTAKLSGPRNAMKIDMDVKSSGGDIAGAVTMDFVRPGWHAAGTVDLREINIAPWFSKPDKPTVITGRASFDLDLGIGRHFPSGPFTFSGSQAFFAGYQATRLSARGVTTPERVRIDRANGIAYGAPFDTTGTIGVTEPYSFDLSGHVTEIDLTGLPRQIPVPHVPSRLTFDYHAVGRFSKPFLVGEARFEPSEFIGARLDAGTHGTIDTSGHVVRYSGSGTLAHVDLQRFGRALEVSTLTEPRFAGTVNGTFDVTGGGTDAASMMLHASGRLDQTAIFGAQITDAAVSLAIDHADVNGTFDGRFEGLNLGTALQDSSYESRLTGRARMSFGVARWLVFDWSLDATRADGTVELQSSSWKKLHLQQAELTGGIDNGTLSMRPAHVISQGTDVVASGRLALTNGTSDLSFKMQLGQDSVFPTGVPDLRGEGIVEGRLTGTASEPRVEGRLEASTLTLSSVSAAAIVGKYSVSLPEWQVSQAAGTLEATADRISIGGQSIEAAQGVVDYSETEAKVQLSARRGESEASLKGSTVVHADHNEVHVEEATLTIAGTRWQLQPTAGGAIQWSSGSVRIPSPLLMSTPDGAERIELNGTLAWTGNDSRFEVKVPALQIATISRFVGRGNGYAGLLSGTLTMTGNVRTPDVRGSIEVTNGQIQGFRFARLTANGGYSNAAANGRLRIDQAPGVWLEAEGTIPRSFGRPGDTGQVDLIVKSSPIDLAIVGPLTSRIASPQGTLTIDLGVRGTAEDPHFNGKLGIANARFLVPLLGTSYHAGDIALVFAPDLMTVERFHLEDDKDDPLDVSGRIATHELRIREIALDVSASKFELLSNDKGDVDVDALVQIQGSISAPTIAGDVVLSHASVNLNPVIEDTFRRPYSVTGVENVIGAEEAAGPMVIGPLWQRLALALRVSIPDDLSLRGDELSPSGGAIGIGDIRVVAGGDLSVQKAASGPLHLVGPLRIVRGTYSFQGKRFDILPDGEVRFTGETPIDPILSLAATRTILGVEARADVNGTWRKPELTLTSTPPLDEADILSLIVFNSSANQLLSEQRYELGVRAAALASGFVTTPILNSVSRAFGFDTLGIDPLADPGGAARITASRQFGTRLFATYVRQLGNRGFNEVLIEYELSRAFRVKGSLSDAALSTRQNLYERVEHFGLDFLFFFSY